MAKKFKQYATNIGIILQNTSVNAHHSIGMIEHYHRPLRQVFSIITTKILYNNLDLLFQMSFKAIKNSVDPNGLVLTLLVFTSYTRMTK